ncbi:MULTISPECIES: NUDIX hydrolase [Rhodococcus]|jgi:8-oxo-dGTP pyrophosphatase MutT (NUDIX family)|uniref:NUDIX domain-containing protein n=1 Tax=Rhodococcus qingshengii JCM 15477 TaxID=1303681 RepID=A0AB38RMX6_RHOSG|nr:MULTISPECIES: NUDIX domain-containing protein [Rhodococcus]KSU69342.1 NUDIX hydrolase [Rhodococcus qingshengii]MDA3635149.1 NUDIX domain-containing protein [Rhodococcus sp. C-2]UPU46505.1 NUDIX domain-containing protein [Rhodococcus qingshengii JCM 15477]SCC66990.1 NUDIX domain-containing protein [Rhodococcus qingshengii]
MNSEIKTNPRSLDGAAAPIKDAASVILVRDGASGIEVFLQRRVKGMAFAGGMTVFPGGRVDSADGSPDIGWSGPSPEWWGRQWGTDSATSRQLVLAAVRETFEECGVLLAGPSADGAVSTPPGGIEGREMLERHKLSFSDYLRREKLIVLSGMLKPWSNWITPSVEPRRYDTRFFVAALPAGQIADDATSEADAAEWMSPTDAIQSWCDGTSMLLPPTWSQLHSLCAFDSVSDVMESRRIVDTVIPEIVQDVGAGPLLFPGSDLYIRVGGTLPWQR